MSTDDAAAREALRARQGAGARYDADAAPHDDLLLARRGTAYFARKLNELSDAELWGDSLRPGQTRRHVIAEVSYQAREIAIALSALNGPLAAEEAEWRPDVALATTLPARALRHLFEHSAKHLDVEWRDLPGAKWDAAVTLLDGTQPMARATPRQRAAAIWQAAVDLGNGARASDIPVILRQP
ncbi:maleylpyruvate isomerase N-terminal domain-containing protein [Tropicibacter naphthalenivorans]|uniref:Mycothiol-dependent maleylpyruvate isomerase n=1 Tax=Tropicibacter naphthalenivorans TaxID=441103 RepID=A0A0P1GH91_9RHOB|nr:maleylpyruvate isomerase N-terminal domain-containing protein [Tropicibacter naphthalenivorans]CUH80919.1 mycothiol-dependent maleylpyruvate isomerase [Tropicibacter naphthalenivorans]SMC91135.1 maleylpyruvate isomerase [Tropicibacter naphthalenivorans]